MTMLLITNSKNIDIGCVPVGGEEFENEEPRQGRYLYSNSNLL
jgi:hypothetical protein